MPEGRSALRREWAGRRGKCPRPVKTGDTGSLWSDISRFYEFI
ncbi:hypothetical protein CLOSTASPAR_02850 [[Clostridium] asparagiforme DSM 15981]|uniref:Uncharacterized protein n=1 Tax=[Clostridium] asparagiforme DSM 15981 TaxID=518636 RepID=C0D0R3_9FIRM|nr:hypothetical protein CLOSTASPAR_02850 [[Clostridium] asparagiforme DSM 15981]